MFEKFVHQNPFFRFFLPLATGVVAGIFISNSWHYINYFIIALLVFILMCHFFKLTQKFYFNVFWGIAASSALFLIGIKLTDLKKTNITQLNNSEYTCIATILEQPEEKPNSYKTTLKVHYIKDTASWQKTNIKILCYLEKDTIKNILNVGSQITAVIQPKEIMHSGNPEAFDYSKYLRYKDINYQIYLKSDHYFESNVKTKFLLSVEAEKIRQKLLAIYSHCGISGDEFAVLSALTLGYKSELTPEIKESFSTSGAMHILAVSGLHVGIIYLILAKLLFFLQRNKYGKIIQYMLVILFLWQYAFISGLSNSVLRATIMFSFIALGKIFSRYISIYNSIFASALIILIYNPYSIMDVGFQLSYAAVLSIVFFQAKVYYLVNIKSTSLDYIWQLVSVAIAAQLGTFPITLYYFDQFPFYFILSNILIIPLATIIIYLSFLLFLLSFSNILSFYVAIVLKYSTLVLNKMVFFIESLPYSKINEFLIDKVDAIILSFLVLLACFFIITKRQQYLKFTFLLCIIFFSYSIIDILYKSQQKYFIVHHIPNTSAINITYGNKSRVHLSKGINAEDKNFNYNIAPFLKYHQVKDLNLKLNDDNTLFENLNFCQYNIIHITNNRLTQYKAFKKLKADFLILSNNVNITIAELKECFDFKEVIFDSSNKLYKTQQWEEECNKHAVSYYNVLTHGAYILSLQ
ncbi:MAG TPA: ComEC/Rec2 family competence protein [Bacteroidales bacterium]|nr:ComEC/Rec2 family competence protein [Bacteroidales bacterium]